jgi:hypothetical protein
MKSTPRFPLDCGGRHGDGRSVCAGGMMFTATSTSVVLYKVGIKSPINQPPIKLSKLNFF